MTSFSGSDDLEGAEFIGVDLSGARFMHSDLAGVVMRGVNVEGADIDAPWLFEDERPLTINGVDVIPLIDAELNRRYPGRELRNATDPEGLRSAWAALERTWAATIDRVAAMPSGTVDVSVDGEWSFAETVRHLIMATDTWLNRAIHRQEQPYHPIGIPHSSYERDGNDMSLFTRESPTIEQVLETRAGRMRMVRNFLSDVTVEDLTSERQSPWAPEYQETVLSCIHTILGEEWAHHRYAVRDLDTIEARTEE
jgi:hypothetical protein